MNASGSLIGSQHEKNKENTSLNWYFYITLSQNCFSKNPLYKKLLNKYAK